MKLHLLLLCPVLHLSSLALAQKKEAYYDYFWEPCSSENARYYSILEKTDSGWFRRDYFLTSRKLQMQALFEDEACKIENGLCQYYHANGYPSTVGRSVHGKQEGICVSYYSNGMMSDSALFHEGRVVDKRLRWYRNGYMRDSITRINDSTEIQVGWFDDGALAYAGYLVNGKQSGKWKYYHHNTQLSSVETYQGGKMLSAQYFNDTGQPQTDTSLVNREADFKGGTEAWKKYLEKKLYWPVNMEFSKAAAVTIGVDFTVDENGNVTDAEVSVPFHAEFDKIALNIVKNSPPWLPAIAHNRKVKAYRRQPITFQQPQ